MYKTKKAWKSELLQAIFMSNCRLSKCVAELQFGEASTVELEFDGTPAHQYR
ncbi:MAG: hypothetical protein K9J37_12010 [Saprospiraceae bacterium]|nr:hypothetical protein [Saprospiraceae bacterium]MCF8250633.1 hypothetical protein [Saprospiraceae bacterium]MCF8282408.1 hypothetical protein [Bacteroidales bacterium]MCF8312264.1 hypothetical protein [Saprospiraceae bacterium]MCF8442821.1 hypothetical protein [Saprospiraceae bacterium]